MASAWAVMTGSAVIIVPTPASLNSSSSTTWGRRPSRRWADPTPPGHGVEAGGDLRDHPAAERAVVEQRLERLGVDLADEAGGIVEVGEQPLDVGEVDHLLGAERLGQGAGDGVGVDVVRLPGRVGADGGHHRDQLLGEQPLEDRRVHRLHVADEAEVGVAGLGADEPGVLAAHADGQRAVHVDGADDVAVHLADEHHAGDVDGLGVGDALAVAELRAPCRAAP